VTVWGWLGGAFYVAFFAWSMAQILGVRRRASRAAAASHLIVGVQAHVTRWARGRQAVDFWRTRPRFQLTPGDWDPRVGFMFLPTVLGVGLVGTAVHALAGAHEDRLAGLPLFGAGAVLVALVVLFLLRPVGVPGDAFEMRSAGYDPDEVDLFLATIDRRAPVEIETVTFHLARPGYEFAAVDDKLDRLLPGATPADPPRRAEGRHRYHARRP
jgi:hypothetical protein